MLTCNTCVFACKFTVCAKSLGRSLIRMSKRQQKKYLLQKINFPTLVLILGETTVFLNNLMAGQNFEGCPLLGLVAAMGSRGFSSANFKILLRDLSEI
jgi:hypothetical protein